MNKLWSLLLLISVLCLSSCGPKLLTKSDAFPNHYKEMPISILVLPPVNTTTAADANEYYATTIAEPLSFAGYYVCSTELVTEILRSEGTPDSDLLLNTPPQKFKEYFGADAVLYITINKWDTSYYVIGGKVTVGLNFILKSTNTSDILWKYSGTMTMDTTGKNRAGGLGGLLLQLAETAIATAATDYVPIAKNINYNVLYTMPYGKYNELYKTDQNYNVVLESVVKDKE
jgi:hypothetical protein